MENFKGTNGNWKRVKLEKTNAYSERNEIHYGNDGECVAEFVSNDYDALLISKAPEMLEMLERLCFRIERDCSIGSDPNMMKMLEEWQSAKKLIKSATEL